MNPLFSEVSKVKEKLSSKFDVNIEIQTISSDHLLYSLLSKLKKKTGYGILLNTSFNVAGEPLVETIQEARKVLSETDLNIVWFPETNQFIMDI